MINRKVLNGKVILPLVFLPLLIPLGIRYVPQLVKLDIADIINMASASPGPAVMVLLGLYCLKAVIIFIPLLVLYLGAAFMFPLGWAILVTYFCLTVEISISYLIGRYFGNKGIMARIMRHEKVKRLLEFSQGQDNGLVRCILLRLIPGVPLELTSMYLGATQVRYLPYIAGTLIGLSRGAVPIILLGAAVTDPFSPQFFVSFIITVLMLISTLLIYKRKHGKI